jgi:hypothetical protein
MPETAKAGRWNHGSSMAKSLRNRRFPNPRGGRWDMGDGIWDGGLRIKDIGAESNGGSPKMAGSMGGL